MFCTVRGGARYSSHAWRYRTRGLFRKDSTRVDVQRHSMGPGRIAKIELSTTLCVHSTTCRTHFFSHCRWSVLLFTVVCQRARTSACCSYRFHNAHALAQAQQLKFVGVVSRMFHPPSLLHPFGHLDLHFPTAPSCSPPTPILPRSVPTSFFPESATPPGVMWSGSLADANLLTGYEPKNDVDNDTEVTPIIFPDINDRETDLLTDLVSEGNQTVLKSGIRQAAANTVF